ncbi:hypothetical protein V2J09_010679 [Rumex salicifolius]
MELVAAAH